MNNRLQHLDSHARDLYEQVEQLPIISPHGHCDPAWWANDAPFPDPASLLIVPDHYVLRLLYSQGVPLEALGVGVTTDKLEPRRIFQLFADHWHCFLGTPSRLWLEYTLYETLNVSSELTSDTANEVFDQIAQQLNDDSFKPRSLYDRFNIESLATTDAAVDTLEHHQAIRQSDWQANIIPTFRPDSVLNPEHTDYSQDIAMLAQLSNADLADYAVFLDVLRERRTYFKACGASATDHDVPLLNTQWLERHDIEQLHAKAVSGTITANEATRYYGHMLTEMAQMSVDDEMVMQLHVGSVRNTNQPLLSKFGPNIGSDIPVAVDWVNGLHSLLNRVGNHPAMRLIAFTLDESAYARELAPMAGHWPCLHLGPPWWFHDSPQGMQRYFDQVVESAGYCNLAGFNDDTRAFLSIPARHDTWRMAVATHLSSQVRQNRFTMQDAAMLARQLCYDNAKTSYRLS